MPLGEERKTRRPNEGELLARYALPSIRPSWPDVAQEVTTAVLELKQETLAAARLRILRFSCWFAAGCKPYCETMGSSMSHTRLDEDSILRCFSIVAAFVLHCNCGEKRPGKACQDLLQRSHESLRCITTAKFAISCNWWNIVLIVTLRNV